MGGVLVQALVALSLVYVFIDLLTHRQVDIRKYDVPGDVVIRYYLNFLPSVIQRIAPFSLLIAALLVLGDAAQNNEVTAVTASGISLRRFVRVPILLSLAFAGALYTLNETVGTAAAVEAERIDRGYFANTDPRDRKGVTWSNLSGGWTCNIDKFNRVALTGEGALLMYFRGPDLCQLIDARRIYWDEAQAKWILEDGSWCVFNADGSLSASHVRRRAALISETPDKLFALDKPAETKSTEQLKQDIAYAAQRGVPSARIQVDYYAKFSQPVLSFVMIWLAIPFAIRLRRGGLAIGFGMSVMIAIAYMLVFSIATGLGYAERISPPVAAWSANALFFAIGLFMYWRTPT